MGRIVLKKAIEREPGFLYYIDAEGNVCKAKMKVGGKKKKRKLFGKKKVKKKEKYY